MAKRDIVQELIEIRARGGRSDTYLSQDALELAEIVDRSTSEHDAILKFVPIRGVTLIEILTRYMICSLVDSGDPYLRNSQKLFTDHVKTLDFEKMYALHGRHITIGELISHTVPVSNISTLNSIMTDITGLRYFDNLSTVYDRWSVERINREKTPILGPKDTWYPILNRMFKVRHCIVHESCPQDIISRQDARLFAEVVERFLSASREFLLNTLTPNAPLTVAALNAMARKRYSDADADLQERIVRMREMLKDDEQDLALFDDAQSKWEAFRSAQGAFAHDTITGGLFREYVRFYETISITQDRIEFCDRWLVRQDETE